MEERCRVGLFGRYLNAIERAGNRLPHPIFLFVILSALIVAVSAVCAAFGVSATGQLIADGELKTTTITAVSLLNREGFSYIFSSAVENFITYAPLGMVLVAMLGVGTAEESGMIDALLKQVIRAAHPRILTLVVVFLGVMSNLASDAGYVILIPLGAMMFRAAGRHPIAGLAAAFAGVSGGFSANLLIGTLDPMLAGISQTAVSIIDSNYEVAVLGNYWFMAASTILITFLGTSLTENFVEPRLGVYEGTGVEEDHRLMVVNDREKEGLKRAGIAALVYCVLVVACCIPRNSFFRAADGTLLGHQGSPFIDGLMVLIALLFYIPGVVYGVTVGTYKNDKDVAAAMGRAMSGMGPFLALAFASAQCVNYFAYTKLGTILALSGASFLKEIHIGLIPLLLLFIPFSAFVNLFMGSASAKWTILAPVFVPMFMLLGYSPELCQLAYRIGDSSTNLITPLMTYYAVILTFAQRYDKKAGVGTLIATMLPYSMCFLLFWTIMLVAWISVGLPIGISTGLFYPAL